MAIGEWVNKSVMMCIPPPGSCIHEPGQSDIIHLLPIEKTPANSGGLQLFLY